MCVNETEHELAAGWCNPHESPMCRARGARGFHGVLWRGPIHHSLPPAPSARVRAVTPGSRAPTPPSPQAGRATLRADAALEGMPPSRGCPLQGGIHALEGRAAHAWTDGRPRRRARARGPRPRRALRPQAARVGSGTLGTARPSTPARPSSTPASPSAPYDPCAPMAAAIGGAGRGGPSEPEGLGQGVA